MEDIINSLDDQHKLENIARVGNYKGFDFEIYEEKDNKNDTKK